ncbi:protein transport protein Sec16A isoform X3 [Cimex lectularius]|uniref:Sec16 Sec23-binding domain-containing protein n=1 Tax=Cimex lectularius TaxID=79782 RepID=A0A8I6SE43_CIMLE|nr:protein transport protein Sec16A isoform X3 [Cimex lectularius]
MEYGQQSDPWSWGDDNSDSQPNEWSAWPSNPKPTLPTQNFMPPIEAHHNKQASAYFESINLQNSHPVVNYSQEYWSHQTNRNKGQIYSDSCGNQGNYNNNNTISDVENKEIAPPDNEISRSATGMVPKADMRTYFTPTSQNSKPFIPPMVSNNFQSGTLDPRQSFIQSQLPPKEGANFHNNPLPPSPSSHPSVNEIPPAQQIMGLPPAPVQVDRPPPQTPCNPALQKTELTSSAQQMNFYQTLQQPQLHAQHQQQPQIQPQQKQQTQSQQKQQGLSQQQHHQQQQQHQQQQLQIQPPQKQQAQTQQMELPKPQMQPQVSHQQMQQHTAANHFPHLTPGSITSMNTFGQMVHPANSSLMQNPSSVHGYGNFQPIPMPIPEKELEARLTPLSTLHDTNSSKLSTNEFHNKETHFQHVNMSNNQMVFAHPNSQDAYNSSLQTLSKQPTPLSSVTELSHKRSESLPQNFPSDTTSHFDRPVYPTVQSGSHNNVNSSCKEELMLTQQQLNSSGSSHPSTSSESLPNHGYNSSLSSSKNSQSLPESDPKIQDQYKAMATNLQHNNQPNASHMPLMMVPTAPSAQLKHDQQDQNLISMPNQFQNTNSTYSLNNTVTRPIASSSPLVTNIPENLEQPDDHHPSETTDLSMQMKSLQLNVDEHTQVLCSLDRNQYLETGHLSNQKESGFVNRPTNVDNLDEGDAPPPGLDRLVTGQVCESHVTSTDPIQVLQMEPLSENDSTRQSTPLSFRGHETRQRHSETEGESESGSRRTGRLVQGQSIGDDTDGREVPGEDNSALNRVVLGQIGGVITPPKQETPTPRSDREAEREREMGRRRMVVGEHAGRDQQQTGNLSDDYRQKHRTRHRLRRGDSSYDEDDRDYDSDRRNEEYKRRDDRNRRRKEHRSPPDYRSDEEYEDRRIYHKSGRNERRPRDRDRDRDYNSPERDYRDYREDRRRYRRYEQYSRDYDDEYYHRENRSRPSSRTGSDYRRNMDYSMRSQRSCYHDHIDFTAINSSDYLDYSKYSAYEYYEKLRQTDPVRYAAWYEQYMKERYSGYQNSFHYGADKASVHSAQSASNQRHSAHTPQIVNEKTTRPNEDEYDIHLFSTNHIKGKLDGQNRLVVIDPNHPLDGQRATINLYKLTQPALDSDTEEFFESPGPFIPGVTHRNTVLQYLKRISEKASKSSEKLLYDLIHLTVKGNGEVNEVDVAELLMNSYKKSEKEEWNKAEDIPVEKLPEKEVVAKFRELLQQGNKTEALDWAIDHGAWGHALFLASKMDDRTHNQIMLRFANSIPHNDPLQTLYQLMSGHIPQSSTCCADKKWSDWRPHLAMILGNPTRDHALDRKAIIQLGDSLNAHGRLFAAHFCYVTAQVEFSQFKPDAKLVLLGSSPNQEFNKFASCRAIMLTMCYEYGLKLRQRDFNIPTLQFYKLILAMRLIDSGRSKCALQYCEMLADETVQCRQSDKRLISDVIDISSRLKMLDPTLALSGETDNDPEWLHKLKLYYNNLPDNPNAGMKISNGFSMSSVLETSQENLTNQVEPLEVHEDVKTFGDPYANYNPSDLTSHLLPSLPVVSHQLPPEVNREDMSGFMMPPPLQPNSYQMEQPPPVEPPVETNNYWDNSNIAHNNSSYTPMQQENNSTANKSFFKSSEEQLKLNEVAPTSKKPDAKQPENKSAKNEEQRSGWFGGIWDKLSMRPKNQMRLPDDSNPSIVWDQEKKRWVNLDGDEEGASTVKPPPRAAEMMNQSMMSNSATPAGQPAPGPNKYKLQKGKLMKSNYVDMMGGTKDKDGPSSLGSLPPSMVTAAPVKNNFFIPSPVEGNQNAPIDFITTTTMNPTLPEALPESNKQQLSRCSSMSSLSREVQYYMSPSSVHPNRPAVHQPMAPMMYNTPRFPS